MATVECLVGCPSVPMFVPNVVLDRTFESDGHVAGMTQSELDASQAVAVLRRIEEAAELLRFGEEDQLEQLSIDALRRLAGTLHVPERSRITDKFELIAEIRRRL